MIFPFLSFVALKFPQPRSQGRRENLGTRLKLILSFIACLAAKQANSQDLKLNERRHRLVNGYIFTRFWIRDLVELQLREFSGHCNYTLCTCVHVVLYPPFCFQFYFRKSRPMDSKDIWCLRPGKFYFQISRSRSTLWRNWRLHKTSEGPMPQQHFRLGCANIFLVCSARRWP